MNFASVVNNIQKRRPDANIEFIERAYLYALEAHKGQKRVSGEDYIIHSIHTANNLATWGMDDETIAAGFLHDVPEDTNRSLSDVQKEFGVEIAKLVEGITKLSYLKYRGKRRYVENLRRMFLAMASDVRVIIVKFADRIHNLSTLDVLPKNKRERIALESIEIFAAIANRLGMGEIKGTIEDLAFPHIKPEDYEWIVRKIEKPREEKIEVVDYIKKQVSEILQERKVHYTSVHGRAKHLYSLYLKALKYNRDISKIHDLVALRIVVKNVSDCYTVLGIIHERWKPLKGKIKDYIAQPKPNGYRSLHTTVFCDKGEIVEFQIRTETMHQEAEYGIAAHWYYKERNIKKPPKSLKQFDWIQQLIEVQKDVKGEKQFMESIKLDIFKNRIFVFTPMGDVIDLPEDSTPIDFAYQIHTEVGNTCCGAKINDKIASLNAKLKNGDVIEVFTDKNRQGPNLDWLEFVVTSTAKSNIKNWKNRRKKVQFAQIIKKLK